MPPSTDERKSIEEARERARLAMQGPERIAKKEEENKDLLERRHTASLAMEGAERRARREQKEKELREKQDMLRRIDEEVKRREAEAKQKEAEAQAAKRNQQIAAENEIRQKEEAFAASKTAIEKLKEERGTTLKAIHTLESDLAEAVKGEQITAEKIAILEQQKTRVYEPAAANEKPKKRGTAALASTALLIIALIAGAWWFWPGEADVIRDNFSVKTIIPAEKILEIKTGAVKKEDLPAAFSSLAFSLPDSGQRIGAVVFTADLNGTKRNLDFSAWLSYSGSAIPDSFSLFIKDYMAGVYKNGSTTERFLLLKVDPYESVYQAILDHENDWVRASLRNLGGADLSVATKDAVFADYLLKNLNTRALRDGSGRTALIYTFFDRQTFIIASSDDALYQAYVIYNTARPR